MSVKTRYLQLSDTTIMEYCMLNEKQATTYTNGEEATFSGNTYTSGFILTKLLDGHYCVFSPASSEVIFDEDKEKYVMKKKYLTNTSSAIDNTYIDTINTINHLAVPADKEDSLWYTFLDNDYEYNTTNNINTIDTSDLKYKEYKSKCTNPFIDSSSNLSTDAFLFNKVAQIGNIPGWDTIKLYFVSGYDFSDMYGALIRLSVKRNDGIMLDLCNFFYTKSNAYKYVKFLSKPIIFGNFIYDKYIEINVLSIAGITTAATLVESVTDNTNDVTYTNLRDLLNINITSNIRLSYSYIDDENKEIKNIEYSINELPKKNLSNKLVNCSFARSSTVNGSIPTQNIQSDNLGAYIALNNDYPYIEFYGTWNDTPLNYETVQAFNNSIQLYDTSLVKKEFTYTVDESYVPEYDMRRWVVLHEVECIFVNTDNEILKEETYSLSQVFIDPESENTKFYYRPIFFDELEQQNLNDISIVFHYTMRLMNIEDSVQFIKSGSITLDNSNSDINRFWGKGAKLPFADTVSYKVYNKIVENKQSLTSGTTVSPSTKYVKVFYNVSNISLDTSNGAIDNGSYTLIISKAPRNYKFVFKQKDINGNNKYVDLTDSYYKLYAKDVNGNDIVIEPTYSSNMNLMLGELEFNLTNNNINKLYNVPAINRYISIVAYNTDNSVSSLYDMRYTF